jgi:hypothetical protein
MGLSTAAIRRVRSVAIRLRASPEQGTSYSCFQRGGVVKSGGIDSAEYHLPATEGLRKFESL